MDNITLKRLFFTVTALSLFGLAGCNNNDTNSTSEVKEVSQLAEEETTSYTEEITALEERVTSLYEEVQLDEENLDEEPDVNLDEEEVSLEKFEAEETLKEDLEEMLDQLEMEEEVDQVRELQKQYGIIETMYNVKQVLADRFEVETQIVIDESELPSDFMMQLQSLEEIKPVFYEKYMAIYEAFVAATGLESEHTEEDTNQARIDAIRNLVLNADGSVNTDLSVGELQSYYNELISLGATDTAAVISAVLNNQPEEDAVEEEIDEDEEETSQPAQPAESRSTRPSTPTPPRTQAPTTQPPRTQPSRTQPTTTQPPRTQPETSQSAAPESTPPVPAVDPFAGSAPDNVIEE